MFLGIYSSFQTNEHIIPELDSSQDSNKSHKNSHLLTYKIYSDLILNLNTQHNISSKNSFRRSAKARRNRKLGSLISNSSSLNFNNEDYFHDFNTHDSLSSEDILVNEFNYVSTLRSIDTDPSYDDEVEQRLIDNDEYSVDDEQESSESNSKLDSYIDSIIELVVRDFILPWLGNLIWDKDKFASMAR